jgi:hypothetical protein
MIPEDRKGNSVMIAEMQAETYSAFSLSGILKNPLTHAILGRAQERNVGQIHDVHPNPDGDLMTQALPMLARAHGEHCKDKSC